MSEVSVSVLDVKGEDYISYFYNIESVKIDFFHIDVMDGKFVETNNVKRMEDYALQISNVCMTPIDVHLMVEEPRKWFDTFLDIGVDRISFHIEACKDRNEVFEFIRYIRDGASKPCIAINPDTDLEEIKEFLPYINMVLVMSVVPGKGGQKFIETTVDKIKELNKYCIKEDLDIDIAVDGGINDETGNKAVLAGANILVAGNYVVNADDMRDAVNNLKNI